MTATFVWAVPSIMAVIGYLFFQIKKKGCYMIIFIGHVMRIIIIILIDTLKYQLGDHFKKNV